MNKNEHEEEDDTLGDKKEEDEIRRRKARLGGKTEGRGSLKLMQKTRVN